jgi:hypothetical protein
LSRKVECSRRRRAADTPKPSDAAVVEEKQQTHRDGRSRTRDDGDPGRSGIANLSEDQIGRNAQLVGRLRGKLILAPLTRGGHLPFRRLCADFGAEVTTSEMVFARELIRGNPVERTRLKRAANEQLYGALPFSVVHHHCVGMNPHTLLSPTPY